MHLVVNQPYTCLMPTISFARLHRYVLKTPTLLTIVVGLLLSGYQAITGTIPLIIQLIFSGLLLAVAGIPHGALDHLMERQLTVQRGEPFSLSRFLAKYLVTMAIYAVAWLFAPVVCLVVFLAISAWHFGETDLQNAPPTPYWSLARLSAGGFVLAFILLTHPAETTPILGKIVQADELALLVWQSAVEQAGSVLRGWGTLTFVLMMLAYGQRPMPIDGWRMARLSIILGLAFYLPLLPAFMLYFGGWHALSSFHLIQNYLPVETKNSAAASWKVWQQALPLTGVAFVFLALFVSIQQLSGVNLDLIPVFFILLSLITLPHISIMHAVTKGYYADSQKVK